MTNTIAIGAVIEDTYLSAGLVDLNSRSIIPGTVRRKKVNPKGLSSEIITDWSHTLKEVLTLNSQDIRQIGIGIPGAVDYLSGYYLNDDKSRYGSLYKQNIIELLSKELEPFSPQIKLLNDAASFFQGEVFAGAVRGYKRSLGITLGAGLGSARYVNGVVEDANLWSSSFKNKMAEDYLSVRWIVNRFKEISGIEVADLVEMKRFSPDVKVDQVFAEFADHLGEFLTWAIAKEKPEIVLIGGQMESSNRYFFDKVQEHVRLKGIKTPVMKAILGEKAGVIGAASIWYSEKLLHVQ